MAETFTAAQVAAISAEHGREVAGLERKIADLQLQLSLEGTRHEHCKLDLAKAREAAH